MAEATVTVHDRYGAEEIAAFYRSGFWRSTSLNQVVAEWARAAPERVYVRDGDTALTYAGFADRALRLAVGLRRAGFGAGQRIAVQLPNWTELPLVAAAASRVGLVVVPIMPVYRDDEVAYVLEHSGAVAAVTCTEFRGADHAAMFERLRERCPALRSLYVARGDGAAGEPLDGLAAAGSIADLEAEAGPDSSPDDGLMIVYTSGTTSRPKGCFHTFNTVRASAATIARNLDYGEDDVQFGPSPITHGTGIVTSVVLPLLAGATSQLMEVWEPERALRLIEEHRCTAAVTATSFLQMLMAAYDPDRHDVSSLRRWVCAGSPIPAAVVEKAGEVFSGCRTLSLYGRSENFLTTMCTVRDPAERSVTSDGAASDGAVVAVVGADGRELPRGEEGDIAYSGPSHMLEYFRDGEATAALFTADGLSRSGDLGRMDAAGFVRVTGRTKDIVIRGGMNISAREVEEHLQRHPRIAAVAVVGMPDERLGERVCAYVVSAGGADLSLDDVTAFLRGHRVAVQKLPERLELVAELPMTSVGKVQKHVLRADVARKLAGESA